MPVAEKLVLKKKLKTELAHVQSAVENIIADCERRLAQKHSSVEDQAKIPGHDCLSEVVASIYSFCDSDQQRSLTSKNHQATMGKKGIVSEMNTKPKDSKNYSHDEIVMVPEKSDVRSVVTGASKGIILGISDAEKGKGEKMDSTKTKQCANTLKILMNHPAGWVFNQPVDPVKLKIPDYFSIISKPMDLGTIKHKLGSKQYSSTVQFAADVRLTFSNAMRYNPPGNEVHVMAKELNNIFSSRWKLLETKWRKESTVFSPQLVTNTEKKKQVLQKKPNSNSFLRRSITYADKLKLKKELSNLSIKKMPPRLLSFLQSKCILGQIGDCDVDLDMFDNETLWELQQIVKNCFKATPTEIKKCARRPEQDSCKGTGETVLRSGVVDESMSSLACMKSTHRTVDWWCCQSNDFSQASSSEVVPERSSGRGHYSRHSTAYDADCKKTSTEDMKSSGVALQSKDAIQSISHPSSPTADREEIGLPCEEQLSPTKALRAAMLRSRFADTILKAQQRSLGEKVDPAKLQQEREKLEKKQREEKARIEAQIKAAEIAARMKAEAELKIQREREREAARLALQKMEKTVEIDNSHILNDLDNLGCPLLGHFDMSDEAMGNFMHEFELQSSLMNPLEQLGLFMKNEDLDEVDDWISAAGNGDVEEGEINYR